MRPIIDLSGRFFGVLTVIDRGANDGRSPAWNCSCACGRPDCRQRILARGENLKTGNTTSCGGQRSKHGRDPSKNRRNNSAYRTKHKDKLKRVEKIRNVHRAGKRRAWNIKRKFGITIKQWNAIFANQNKCCAACSATAPGGRGAWMTDHCHETGVLRGILCQRCNTTLGWLGDTLPKVKAYTKLLVKYLKRQARSG